MRCAPEQFGDSELELVQLSRRLREARRVEDVLTEAGRDYHVEAAEYRSRIFFFPVRRIGAHFYVRNEEADACRKLLAERGFTIVEMADDEE